MFSKACEYAIRATFYIYIKSIDGSKLSIKEIAGEIDSPVHFTAKILQTLSRQGIVSSAKGPNGGFYCDPKADPIYLNSIVKAIDGDDVLYTCTLGLKECSNEFPCPIHHEVIKYKDTVRQVMKERTVQELAPELSEGKTFLKID